MQTRVDIWTAAPTTATMGYTKGKEPVDDFLLSDAGDDGDLAIFYKSGNDDAN